MQRKVIAAIVFLLALHVVLLFAGFFAPCDPATQNRDFPYAPPTRLHFVDVQGHLHFRPFVYQWTASTDGPYQYEESRQHEYPVHLLVRGARYKVAGIFPSHIHLFGVDFPASIFLAGTDNYGRDQFSRILFGG